MVITGLPRQMRLLPAAPGKHRVFLTSENDFAIDPPDVPADTGNGHFVPSAWRYFLLIAASTRNSVSPHRDAP